MTAFPFLMKEPLLSVGRIIFDTLPSPESGFDWFHIRISDNKHVGIRKVIHENRIIDAAVDLTGYILVPVTSFQRITSTPKTFLMTLSADVYFSDEADAVYVASLIERNNVSLDLANKNMTDRGYSGRMHGLLQLLSIWDASVF